MRPDRIARAYRATRSAEEKALRAADAVFTGIWLGVMDRRSLSAADAAHYEVARESVGDERLLLDAARRVIGPGDPVGAHPAGL